MLRSVVSAEEVDIVAITESWLDMSGKLFLPEVQLDGFNIFHKDRSGRKGGGVVLYVKSTLQCCINSSIRVGDDNTESVWVDVTGGRDKIVLGLIYRPPNESMEVTSSLLQEIARACRYRQVCILGDFNFRNIDWGNITGDREAEEFLNVVQNNFLKQVIREPTRQGNILDLVLTKSENDISEVEVGGQLGNSDHNEIRFNVKWGGKFKGCNNVKVPDFRRADYTGLRNQLADVNWEAIGVGEYGSGQVRLGQDTDNLLRGGEERAVVNESYLAFVHQLIRGQEQHIPYRKVRSSRNDPRWMTYRIKHLIGLKRGLYKRIRDGEETLRCRYNELARTIKKTIRGAKRDYEIRVANNAKQDPKGFFQLYRTKTKENVGPIKLETGEVVGDSREMSKLFNDYFLSVFTHENILDVPAGEIIFQGREEQKLRDIVIDAGIVRKELDRLKSSKSPGVDEIYPRILKECKEVLSSPLANVFRESVDNGIVPDLWKQANVVPIFKKGDRAIMTNYRPISLTSVVGKMLESIIASNIREHLETYKLINDSQHGFSKGKSTLTNLLSFYRKVF